MKRCSVGDKRLLLSNYKKNITEWSCAMRLPWTDFGTRSSFKIP